MAQTAVDWFFMTMNIIGLLPNKEIVECYKEARAMEKEQHYNTYKAGASLALMSMKGLNGMSFAEYYFETYGDDTRKPV
jgi:hypothetical protein